MGELQYIFTVTGQVNLLSISFSLVHLTLIHVQLTWPFSFVTQQDHFCLTEHNLPNCYNMRKVFVCVLQASFFRTKSLCLWCLVFQVHVQLEWLVPRCPVIVCLGIQWILPLGWNLQEKVCSVSTNAFLYVSWQGIHRLLLIQVATISITLQEEWYEWWLIKF